MKKLLFLSLLIFVSSSYPRSGLQQFAQAVGSQLNAYGEWHEKTLQANTQAEQEFVASLREFALKNVQSVRNAAHATIQVISSHVTTFAQWREKTLQKNKQVEKEYMHALGNWFYTNYQKLNAITDRQNKYKPYVDALQKKCSDLY